MNEKIIKEIEYSTFVDNGYPCFQKCVDLSKYFTPLIGLYPVIVFSFFLLTIKSCLNIKFILEVLTSETPVIIDNIPIAIIKTAIFITMVICFIFFIVDFIEVFHFKRKRDKNYPSYTIGIFKAFQMKKYLKDFYICEVCTLEAIGYSFRHENREVKNVEMVFKNQLINGTFVTVYFLTSTLLFWGYSENFKKFFEKIKKQQNYNKKMKEENLRIKKEISEKVIKEMIGELKKQRM